MPESMQILYNNGISDGLWGWCGDFQVSEVDGRSFSGDESSCGGNGPGISWVTILPENKKFNYSYFKILVVNLTKVNY